ncbi:MAG: hypothetical protein HQ567_16515 [Candidatus Nealsonbacteria bacterium]|nr:hypothetical protein [Candidatus Nealsonbacteria bacterium]
MDVETQFWSLVETANQLDEESWRILNDDDSEPVDSNRMVEPTYLAICKLVSDHPEMRDVFVRCFSDLVLLERKSPWMLVPFCMRVLKMPEIRDTLGREMDENRGTARYASLMNYCSSVMHAYLDEVWENAIAFDHFAHELGSQD